MTGSPLAMGWAEDPEPGERVIAEEGGSNKRIPQMKTIAYHLFFGLRVHRDIRHDHNRIYSSGI
jgi:hypothetical protein